VEAEDAALRSLRLACFGGDRLAGHDIARLARLAPRATSVNFYGATETPQAMGFHVVEAAPAGPVPLGRGIEGVQLLVVNAAGELAGAGEEGEILVRTPYLARGYLGDETLTRERFPVNPFTDRAGDRVYATGDRGRYRLDGTLDFCGRRDGQVKLRGYRIELGEIEAVLAEHPSLRAAAVVAREEAGEKRLVAYLVPRAGREPATGELRRFAAAALPEPMVPSAFVVLEKLPLTPNGKLDRRALPAPGGARPNDRQFVAPRDEVEASLARIFEEVLGLAPVGSSDDFFELGGHSLLAVRVVAAVRRRFERALPLVALFQDPTVERLAIRLRASEGGGAASALVRMRAEGSRAPLFLVHAAGGTVAGYHALVARLGDRPIYGLQAEGLEGEGEAVTRLDEMAARYVARVLEVRRRGPIHLVGWSLGGVIAFEMARQLVEAGRELGTVALLDTNAPGRSRWSDPRALETLVLPDELPEDLSAEDRERLVRVLRTNLRAVHGAPPRAGRVPVLLLRASEGARSLEEDGDGTLGWSALTPERVVVRFVPGNHESLLEPPHVSVLAEELDRILEEGLRPA
jgi:thioesterase domain-containing protein